MANECTLWTKDGKLIKNSEGKLILSRSCPCVTTEMCQAYYLSEVVENTAEEETCAGVTKTFEQRKHTLAVIKSGNPIPTGGVKIGEEFACGKETKECTIYYKEFTCSSGGGGAGIAMVVEESSDGCKSYASPINLTELKVYPNPNNTINRCYKIRCEQNYYLDVEIRSLLENEFVESYPLGPNSSDHYIIFDAAAELAYDVYAIITARSASDGWTTTDKSVTLRIADAEAEDSVYEYIKHEVTA